jgi:hypothetical protein
MRVTFYGELCILKSKKPEKVKKKGEAKEAKGRFLFFREKGSKRTVLCFLCFGTVEVLK